MLLFLNQRTRSGGFTLRSVHLVRSVKTH